MKVQDFRGLLMLIALLALAAAACGLTEGDGPPGNSAVVEVTANTTLGPWLSEVVAKFNEAELETTDGKPAYAVLSLAESGQTVADLATGEAQPDMWIPEEQAWTDVAAEQGISDYQDDCQSVATSPLVIAMWRPVAEALGWPGLPLGWLDVGSLAADPSAWNYYSGGEYGEALRLGHTHPGLSGSGASTLLAIVQSAESKSDAVSVEDIALPIVQASVSAFETAVSTFSSSTQNLAETMNERGPQYLGAAVMYESNLVSQGNSDIVPIYPLEGTFVADFPACINRTISGESAEAAAIFRDYLSGEEAQQLAVSKGLRPVNPAVTVGPPLDESRGVNLDQPEIVFNSPNVETIYAAQDLWKSARKDVNLVMLLDVSGSMAGQKMDNMVAAAKQFADQMGDDDYLTIIAFSHELPVVVDHQQVGPARGQIISIIDSLEAGGDTALYDAIGTGAGLIAETSSPATANALVVLTDGQDTFSYIYNFDQNLLDLASANDTTVFAIAYGDDADQEVLSALALGANGNFYLGDEASIAAIYEEMSAAFGGSAGIGR